jgi:CheY-like chemotaxis protein
MSAPAEELQILLVEDSPDDVFFFKRALQKCGCAASLRVAEDGAKAVQFLQSNAGAVPQLMFLDLKMPNVNGFEVLEWLGQQPFRSAIRVIVLTSSEEPRERQLARALGAVGFITKPVSSEQLREYILSVSAPAETLPPHSTIIRR